MTAPYLILAVGNESRGDDALGPLLLRCLSDWLAHSSLAGRVELIEEFQLQVENALDLHARKLVLFLDAASGTRLPYVFYEAREKPLQGHTSHAVAPEALLGVYLKVMGEAPPPMFILGIAGEAFELGTGLSASAQRHLSAAFEFVRKLWADPNLAVWRIQAASGQVPAISSV
jgi:hydrogenase maturation protease